MTFCQAENAAEPELDTIFNPTKLSRAEKRVVQSALTFSGYYEDRWDGAWGRLSNQAFKEFARREADDDEGLNSSVARALFYGLITSRKVGWQNIVLKEIGVTFGLPVLLLDEGKPDGDGVVVWSGEGLSVSLRFNATGTEVNQLHKALIAEYAGAKSRQKEGSGWMQTRITAQKEGAYLRSDWLGDFWASIVVKADADHLDALKYVSASFVKTSPAMLRSFDEGTPNLEALLKQAAPMAQEWVAEGGYGERAAIDISVKTSGSGFFISDTLLVTNAHVVNDCENLKIESGERLDLLASDDGVDLALLKVEGRSGASLPIAAGVSSPRLGQHVYALGYPLYGVVSHGLNFTEGVVSSESGIRDDPDRFSMSGALQPGNSGGPVIASDGRVVGVASAILVSQQTASNEAVNSAGINYAIKGGVLTAFLEANEADYRSAASAWDLNEGVPDSMRDAVVPVLCTY